MSIVVCASQDGSGETVRMRRLYQSLHGPLMYISHHFFVGSFMKRAEYGVSSWSVLFAKVKSLN